MRQKARLGVSYSHLNKHRLINSLEGWIDETGLWPRNTRTGLPPKISPKLPGSEQGQWQEARDLLAEVYAWLTEGLDTADLQQTKVLLEELA